MIGYKVILYGCMIKDNVLIGMGVIVLNGVVIGLNCIVGVNVLIFEGKVILDNFLVVGVFGKVVCMLDDVVVDGILKLVGGYVCNWM